MAKKILVVDDEEELLGLVTEALTEEGYEVTSYTTAEEGVEAARKIIPDIILMDIVLPDMEGPEAVRLLMEDPVTRDIPVIFLSGIITQEQKGVVDVRVGGRLYKAFGKPFAFKDLMAEVRKAIG